MTSGDLAAIVPALLLAGSAVVASLLAIPRWIGPRTLAWLGAAASLAAAAIAVAAGTGGPPGTVARDGPSAFWIALVGIAAAASLVLAAADPRPAARSKGEVVMALFSASGAVLVVVAADLVVLFVGLALLAIPAYVLTGRYAPGGDDATVRHFLLGATSSAVALYGIALLYAATGETGYAALGRATHNPLYLAGLGLTFAGLAAHVALAPAHRWSVVVNVAAVGALLRLMAATGSGAVALDEQVSLAVAAGLALAVAGLAALGERRVRRLIGYATISQLGYVAVALAGSAPAAVAFALATYAALAVGLFAVLAMLPPGEPVLEDLGGLARRRPLVVLALAVAVIGLIGVPPTAEFIAKIVVFEAAGRAQLLWLVILGTLGTVAGAASFARLGFACFAPPRMAAIAPPRARIATAIALLAALVSLAVGVVPGPLLDAAQAVRF
jgi:NADH-quinone oxidoreductase subunit N